MKKEIGFNKQNLMKAKFWIIAHNEEIVLNRQCDLSLFNSKELEVIKYCCKTLESLIEAKEIYDRQKIKERV
ncbi:hypothetical protein BUY45_08665 [Staphylococcus devriesei]|nr:hypothetical protein BUY45_08665 [Staphylococcus devriesei]